MNSRKSVVLGWHCYRSADAFSDFYGDFVASELLL